MFKVYKTENLPRVGWWDDIYKAWCPFCGPTPLCFIQVLFIHIIWEVLHRYNSEVFLQKIVSVSWRNLRPRIWQDQHAPRPIHKDMNISYYAYLDSNLAWSKMQQDW